MINPFVLNKILVFCKVFRLMDSNKMLSLHGCQKDWFEYSEKSRLQRSVCCVVNCAADGMIDPACISGSRDVLMLDLFLY